MKDYAVWIDVVMRLAIGGLLLAAPRSTLAALGLPKASETFWPRMVGVLLISMAAGSALDARWIGKSAPVPVGFVAVNLGVAFAMATALFVGQLDIPKRGRSTLWLASASCAVLALFQLAWV